MEDSDKIHILLVEDNKADINLMTEIFRMLRLNINLSVAKDGAEAMNFLFGEDSHRNVKGLQLIILDINIPLHNGFDILIRVRKNEVTRALPVVILTSSKYDADVFLGYRFEANAVLFKTPDFYESMELIQSIYNFWIKLK